MAVSVSCLFVPVAYGSQCPAPRFAYEPDQFLQTDEPLIAEADRVVSEDGVVVLAVSYTHLTLPTILRV